MMLHDLQIAQLEHRERIRAFNVRAARGEFVRYSQPQRESARQLWSDRLARLGRGIRQRLSRRRSRSLVMRPGADSV